MLSAIQDALDIHEPCGGLGTGRDTRPADEDLFIEGRPPRRRAEWPERASSTIASSLAANNDRASIGQIQTLPRPPARTPYVVAAIFSVAPCSTGSPPSPRPWSARPSRCAPRSPTCISIYRLTSVCDRVNEAAARIARALAKKGEHITVALGHAGGSMIDALGERGGDLLDRLERTGWRTDSRRPRRSSTIQTRSHTLTQTRSSRRLARWRRRSRRAPTRSTVRSSRPATDGDSIVLDLSLRGGDVVSKIEQITDTLIDRSDKVVSKIEQTVFNKRLYTMPGQQAFDEISKRYRADRELKQTVDRYIGEFERLLEEVSRDHGGKGGGAQLSRLGDWQRLRHAGARSRPIRLTFFLAVVSRGRARKARP